MEYNLIRYFDLFIEGIFLGFGTSVCLFYFLSRFKHLKLKSHYEVFLLNSFLVIRVTGLIYVFYFLYLVFDNYERLVGMLSDTDSLPYLIFFSVRSLLIIFLSQLFWYKKIGVHKTKRTLIITVLFGLALFASHMIEKFVMITINFYRDFLPEHHSVKTDVLFDILYYSIQSSVLFCVLVTISWAIRNKIKPR